MALEKAQCIGKTVTLPRIDNSPINLPLAPKPFGTQYSRLSALLIDKGNFGHSRRRELSSQSGPQQISAAVDESCLWSKAIPLLFLLVVLMTIILGRSWHLGSTRTVLYGYHTTPWSSATVTPFLRCCIVLSRVMFDIFWRFMRGHQAGKHSSISFIE